MVFQAGLSLGSINAIISERSVVKLDSKHKNRYSVFERNFSLMLKLCVALFAEPGPDRRSGCCRNSALGKYGMA
jgi:hypothetical protein